MQTANRKPQLTRSISLGIFAFFLAVSIFLVQSCKKEFAPVETAKKVDIAKLSTSDILHSLAKALIEDKKVGGNLENAQIALYKQTQNEEFLLVDLVGQGVSQRTPAAVQEVLIQNPLLEIGYPSFAFQENETFEQHLAKIKYYVVLDEDVDLEQVTTLPAYDTDGNAVIISTTHNESICYAVIRIDEAHDAVRNGESLTLKGHSIPISLTSFEPSRVEGDVKYYDVATFINAESKDRGPISSGTATYRGGGEGTICDRPANKKDQLYKVRFSNKAAVKVVEGFWDLPNVELNLTYVFGTVSGTGSVSANQITTLVDKNWSKMNGNDWANVDVLNQQIRTWGSFDADIWAVGVIEADGNKDTETNWSFGATPKYTVNKKWDIGFPVSFGIKRKKGDTLAGQIIIEYCDRAEGEGTSYKIYTGGSDGMFMRENFQ